MVRDMKKSKKHNLKGKKILKRLHRAVKQKNKVKEEKLYKVFLQEYY